MVTISKVLTMAEQLTLCMRIGHTHAGMAPNDPHIMQERKCRIVGRKEQMFSEAYLSLSSQSAGMV